MRIIYNVEDKMRKPKYVKSESQKKRIKLI